MLIGLVLSGLIINLSGQDIIITSDDFSVDSTGKIFARSGTIGGFDMTANSFSSDIYSEYDFTEEDLTKIKNYIMGEYSLTEQELEVYDVYKDGIIDARDYMMIKNYMATGINKSAPGKVELTNGDVFNTFTIKDGFGKDLINLNAQESYIQNLKVNQLVAGNLQSGTAVITPVANTPTSIDVEFANEYGYVPKVIATPVSEVPGTKITGVAVNNITTTGFTLWLTRTDDTETSINWIAI